MIEFCGVGHTYGERTVLDGIDLRLPQQRIGFVGANGSGKSTLARTINGLVHPTRGRVLVDGLDAVRDGRQVRRRVGFIFTNPDSQIVMPTAGEDVAFCHGLNRMASTPDGAPEGFTLWFRMTTGLRKENGSWRISHEHTSTPFYMDGSFRAATDLTPPSST